MILELVHVPRPKVVRFGVFGEGGMVAYEPPANTLDPRYDACTDHHVACDCREAEHAEYRSESHADRQALVEAAARILAGHPTWADDDASSCQCTGCQLARAAHVWELW